MRHYARYPLQISLCLLLAWCLPLGTALAQKKMTPQEEAVYKNMLMSAGMDPDEMAEVTKRTDNVNRWNAGSGIIDYHVVGVFQGRTNVAGNTSWIAYADVSDRVVMDLKWKLSESKLVGTPSIQNTKSIVKNPRNPEPSCNPPVIQGDYEHYEVLGVKQGLSGMISLQIQTSYPVVEIVQFCTGSRKSIPAFRNTWPDDMSVPSPVLFDAELPDSDALRVSPDKKSLIVKKGGWTWTFTPSVKK